MNPPAENKFSYIGRNVARPDAGDKVSGKAIYIHDFARPGMLFGQIKFSEHAHARIAHIDTRKAERLPGVKAVLTASNAPRVSVGFLRDNVALKGGKVRQFRDEIAAVAAIDRDIAREAVDLIRVDYEPLPGVFDPQDAMRPDAPLVHEIDVDGKPRTTNRVPLEYGHKTGDIDAAKRRAKFVAEGRYTVPLIQQSCMGTAGCVADFDASGNLTIWAKTQIPFLAQRDFNRALDEMGLKGRNTRVIVPALGGGFGTGLDTHCYEYICILLAHATGKPVKILYDREQEFRNLSPRQSARTHVRQGCDENGALLFREIHVIQDNGAYTSWGATYPTVMLLPVTSLYRVPVVHFSADIVYTNNTYAQAMRGYGNPEVTWPIESNLDDLAKLAGIDPYEMRAKNANRPDEVTPMGLRITTCGLKECLDATAQKLGWHSPRSPDSSAPPPEPVRGTAVGDGQRAARRTRKKRGFGMASLIHVGGSGRIYRSDASGLILKLDDFGNVNVYYGGVEMGQGLHAALEGMVAEALGVRPENVFINPTDTGTCPWDVGTHASRGAFMAGNAVCAAAEKMRSAIFELAPDIYATEMRTRAKKLFSEKTPPELKFLEESSPSDFELREGWLFSKRAPDAPWAKVDLGRFARAMHFRPHGQMLTVEAFYDPPTELPNWETGMGNMSATYTFGTQGVEVTVDEETGEVEILRLVNAIDVGRVLNPQALEGQMYGGIGQGVGYALYEEVKTKDGRILNAGFTDYKLPSASELAFPIDLVFIETDDPAGPFGAKGVGEPALVPTAPAIGNAIYDAIGVRLYDLPMTPERVLAAIKRAKG